MIASLELFWAFIALLSIIDSEGEDIETIPECIIIVLTLIGGPMAFVAIRSTEKLDSQLAKVYYRWFLIRLLITAMVWPCELIETCQIYSDYSSDENDCEDLASDILLSTSIYLAIGLYSTWVIHSLYVRLEAGQLDLCQDGPRVALTILYHRSEIRHPSVVQGVQVNPAVYIHVPEGENFQGDSIDRTQGPTDAQRELFQSTRTENW
eukprot:CAMPEP_0115003602 /NCGR_PEP_ID=MMETSP0216-20121206/18711_1 /TAXON_ID=223996 /ORGANISM="Protocruzia adherens, Strain Boccale" /LENGTH=207 /DNA_ID=CAMNT_0002369443 /DNA_START=218 /DNA_END=838 /DNA_ORIENTATION=+